MDKKIIKMMLKNPRLTTYSEDESSSINVSEDISHLFRDNIVGFKDDDKVYFMDKITLEIVSEFDRVKE